LVRAAAPREQCLFRASMCCMPFIVEPLTASSTQWAAAAPSKQKKGPDQEARGEGPKSQGACGDDASEGAKLLLVLRFRRVLSRHLALPCPRFARRRPDVHRESW